MYKPVSIIFFLFILSFSVEGQKKDSILISKLRKESELYWRSSNMDKAISTYYTILNLAEKNKDSSLMCLYYVNLMLVYNRLNDMATIEKLLSQSKDICKNCKSLRNKASWYVRLANLYYFKNQMDSALMQLDTGAMIFFMAKDTVRAYGALSKKAKYYYTIERPELATKDLILYHKHSLSFGDPTNVIRASNDLAEHYNRLLKPDSALYYIDQYKNLSKSRNDHYYYARALENQAKANEIMGNYKEALYLYQKYNTYFKDSVMYFERLSEIENYKTKYETDKKDLKISLQQQALKSERFKLWASIIGLVLTLGGGIFLFTLMKKLRKSNVQKEYLIKEIHHRVKNNLQVLSSLLYLQSRYIKDDIALDAMREGQHRVDAMGLIHKKLYTGDDYSTVEMSEYLSQLGDSLLESFGFDEGPVTISTEVEEIRLDVDMAIPLGLICNELITNALKYAFPRGSSGEIIIRLKRISAHVLCLEVIDNGKGEQDNEKMKGTSFGFNLIDILCSKLKATMRVDKSEGYKISITFNQNV